MIWVHGKDKSMTGGEITVGIGINSRMAGDRGLDREEEMTSRSGILHLAMIDRM